MRDGPIYHKFDVTRTDRKDEPHKKHYKCDYFVLDLTHDPFALDALWAYAIACVKTHPVLSGALRAKVILARGTQGEGVTERVEKLETIKTALMEALQLLVGSWEPPDPEDWERGRAVLKLAEES